MFGTNYFAQTFGAGGAVSSVFSRTGAVVAVEADYTILQMADVTAVLGAGTVVQMASGTVADRRYRVTYADDGTTTRIVEEAIAELREEFRSGGTSSTTIGQLGWTVGNAGAGAATASMIASEAGRPGITRLSATGTTDDDSGAFSLGNAGNDDFTDMTQYEWDAVWIFRPGTVTSVNYMIGLVDTTAVATTAGMYLKFDTDASDTNYEYIMDGTGVDTGDTTVAPNASNWIKFKIRRRTSGVGGNPTIYMSLNDANEQTWCSSGCTFTTTNIPTAGLKAVFMAQTRVALTAATVDCDFFLYRQYGLTR